MCFWQSVHGVTGQSSKLAQNWVTLDDLRGNPTSSICSDLSGLKDIFH